jgi:hypothetical protein
MPGTATSLEFSKSLDMRRAEQTPFSFFCETRLITPSRASLAQLRMTWSRKSPLQKHAVATSKLTDGQVHHGPGKVYREKYSTREDGSITIHQKHYVEYQIEAIELDKGRKTEKFSR